MPSTTHSRISPARLLLVASVACYVAIFNMSYRDLVAPTFAFFGLGYNPPPALDFWLTFVLCLVPACWMPLSFSRPSLLLFYAQYLVMFIPAAFVVYHSIRPTIRTEDARQLVILMFVGLSIMQLSYRIPVRQVRGIRLAPGAFWTIIVAGGGVLFLYLVATLAGNFRLANFVEIYDVRAAMAERLDATGSRFGFYAFSLLFAFFLPVLFAVGTYSRKWWLIAVVTITYVFLFGIGGTKAAILSLVYLPMMYGLMRQPPRRTPFLVVAGLSGLLLLGYGTAITNSQRFLLSYVGVVHFRLFSVPALTIPQYFGFFETHPVTHLAHVSGFNKLLPYAFEYDVPYSVGRFFYRASIGVNSGTWAGDGLAGFGPWGIVVMSVVVAVTFWVFDSAAAGIRVDFAAMFIATTTLSFASVSFFTTLITGGLSFIILALLLAPRDDYGFIALPALPMIRPRVSLQT